MQDHELFSPRYPPPSPRLLTLSPPPEETQRVFGDSLEAADVDIAGPLDAAAARGVVQKAALRIVEEEAGEASADIPAAHGILKTRGRGEGGWLVRLLVRV